MILTLLKKHFTSLTIVTLSIALMVLNSQNKALEAERDNNATQLAWANELLTVQSDAVDSLTKQREEDRKAYLAGIQAANKRAIQLEVSAERILSLPTPTDTAEQCTAAEALLRKELTQ